MKRYVSANPDPFSLSPLVALLPVRGDVGRLEALTSSLFARYEKVSSIQREMQENVESPEVLRRTSAEAAMLRQVLDWLAVTPGEGREES